MKIAYNERDLEREIKLGRVEIEKTDIIRVLFAGDENWVIVINDVKNNKEMKIRFEDSETLEYFYEKLRKEHIKTRPTVKYRLNRRRLKSIEINKEMYKIAVKVGRR